jgi:hypothetical protein
MNEHLGVGEDMLAKIPKKEMVVVPE